MNLYPESMSLVIARPQNSRQPFCRRFVSLLTATTTTTTSSAKTRTTTKTTTTNFQNHNNNIPSSQ
jgi:hypothetical protein